MGMGLTGLVPARFLTMVAHLVIVIVILWSKEDNLEACLPPDYTQDQYDDKDTELSIGLSVSLGLLFIELVGFFGGITMFSAMQGLISTLTHTSAAVTLAYFLFDNWECDTYWYIFGFCSCFPAVTEIIVMIGVLAFGKF